MNNSNYNVSSPNTSVTENINVIFKDKQIYYHTKSINKIFHLTQNYYFTGGRDSVIKLWKSNNEEKMYSKHYLKYNLIGHTDWINDIDISSKHNLLFSASNDNSIQIFDLNRITITKEEEENDGIVFNKNVNNLFPVIKLNELHCDYVTCLEYNNSSNTLFSGGLDSNICFINIDKITKYSRNILAHVEDEKSIYSLSCSENGQLVAISAYQNNIIYYDVKSSSEIMRLNRQLGIIKNIKLSPNGLLLLSASSDGNTCLWDLRMQNKIYQQWNHYKGSITTLIPTDNFHSFYSTDSEGNVYLDNITSNTYSLIDNVKERITAFAYKEDTISLSTINGSFYQYKKSKFDDKNDQNKISRNAKDMNETTKQPSSLSPLFSKSSIMNIINTTEEIIKYYILKNKLYILLENRKKDIMLFSLLKLKITYTFNRQQLKQIINTIKLTNNKSLIENSHKSFHINLKKEDIEFIDVVNLLESYSKSACRTWFNVDIKLGSLRVCFTKDIFSWKGEYQFDFLDYIIATTKNLTLSDKELDEKKLYKQNRDKFSNTISGNRSVNLNNSNNTFDKNEKKDDNPGYRIISNLYKDYQSVKLLEDEEEIDVLVKSNFKNYDEYIKRLKKVNKENLMNKGKIISLTDKKSNFSDVSSNKISNTQNTNSSLTSKEIYSKMNYDYGAIHVYINKDKAIIPIILKCFEKYDYVNFLKDNTFPLFDYKYFPSYVRDCLPEIKDVKVKEKIDVKIDLNKYKDFCIKKSLLKKENNDDTLDDVEVYTSVKMEKFKRWIFNEYIDQENFKERLNVEMNGLKDPYRNSIKSIL